MKIDKLFAELKPYIIKSIIKSDNINIEYGVSLLVSPFLIEQNKVYFCKYHNFLKFSNNDLLQAENTFFITDCFENIELPPLSERSSYFFLSCSIDDFTKIVSNIFSKYRDFLDERKSLRIQAIWKKLITSPASNSSIILEDLKKYLAFPFNSFVACIVISNKQPDIYFSSNSLVIILDELSKLFPQTNIFIYKNKIIILYSQTRRPNETLSFSYKKFSLFLQKYNLISGISNACRQVNMLPTLYRTALSSIQLGEKIKCKTQYDNIYQYEEISIYYMIDLSAKEFIRLNGHSDIIFMIHPCIIELYRYDKKNNTDLLKTLFHYIICGCNAKLTAESLFVHRNTVFNKLRKIESLITLSLDNGLKQFRLLMSCFVVTYYQEYLELSLRV